MADIWKPSVTVAAIIERHGKFLLVEEMTSDGLRFNQQAGHLDPDESLLQAVVRETLEETAHDFTPTALVGAYLCRSRSTHTGEPVTYLRFAFCGEAGAVHDQPLDAGIQRALWMTYEEIRASAARHRSPLVLECIDDYLAGTRGSLSLVKSHPSALGIVHG
jgi:8-oxo-dGTP pyrophosphatase MutT (NUDIX family)